MNIDWEQFAIAALQAHEAIARIDRRMHDPSVRLIMQDLRLAHRHSNDLTEATAEDVRRILRK